MSFCEVITDFKMEQFDILQRKINLDKALILTDNLVVQQIIQKLGYNIKEMRQQFGYVSPELYSIYDKAITNMKTIKQNLDDIKYGGISLVDGLKSYILDRLIFLEKIESIFEQGKDVVFLFSNTSYHYFAIPMLAEYTRYQSHGIYHISDSDLIEKDFEQIYRINYGDTYEKIKKNDLPEIQKEKSIDTYESTKKHFSQILSTLKFDERNAECAFFLINNLEDFYLKPIYPIIDKFTEKISGKMVFTFGSRTKTQLENKNIKSFDLSVQIDELESKTMERDQQIISYFFNRITNMPAIDNVIKSYVEYFQNDIILRNVARILAVVQVVHTVFEESKFKSVLVGADGVSETDLVCEIAKIRGISTYSIPPAMTESNPMYGTLYNADKLLLSGPRLKNELNNLGVKEERLLVTGNARYDYINGGKFTNTNQNTNLQKKLIVVAMSRMHENDEVWMSELIHFCNQNNLDILIKLHPLYKFNPDLNEICEQKIKMIQENCSGIIYQISYDVDITSILPRTSIFITEYSLVGVEAALNEIPLICINPDNEIYYDYSLQFHKEGIALYAKDTSELFESIHRILNYNDIVEQLGKSREKFGHEFNYLNDGKASERIFDILTKSN